MLPLTIDPTLRAVVFDLDGVIRHFDPAVRADIERRYDVTSEQLWSAAFGAELGLGEQAVTGQISRQQWVALIGEATGQPDAVAEWLGYGGYVDADMVQLIAQIRQAGLVVALLTNGTDTIPAELAHHDLQDTFDVVFNSADLGIAKPDARVYRHVLTALSFDPAEVFFTDDTAANIKGAKAVGIRAHHFEDITRLRPALASEPPV